MSRICMMPGSFATLSPLLLPVKLHVYLILQLQIHFISSSARYTLHVFYSSSVSYFMLIFWREKGKIGVHEIITCL